MNSHSAEHESGFNMLLAALHLPRRPALPAAPKTLAAPTDWLERLATWAERQPMHHRLGSYMLQRWQ